MGKYLAESVGKLPVKIGQYETELKPQFGDGRRVQEILLLKDEKGTKVFLSAVFNFIKEQIQRVDPPKNDEENKELDLMIDLNFGKVMEQIFMPYAGVDKEELASLKKEALQAQGKGIVSSGNLTKQQGYKGIEQTSNSQS